MVGYLIEKVSSKELFFKIMKADLEAEVTEIINEYDMHNTLDWQAFGGNWSNYSVIGNQSSTSEGALAEKLTNAVDALVVRKCMELGIDPKGPDAPKNFKEALQKFWGIVDGDPRKLSKDSERDILDSLVVMATTKDLKTWKTLAAKEKELSLAVYDNGEGQSPNRLPETILSLLKGNKHDIPFTQGNHNQGGSSTLMHGGKYSYTLIISKRNINIVGEFDARDDDSLNEWGWTLVRQELRVGESSPVFTYYAPNGKIPRFEADELPLLPRIIKGQEAKDYLNYDKSCTAGVPFEKDVNSGTLIKMFNYNIKNKGPLVSHFKYEMGKRLYDTGLPFNLIDCRKNKFNNDTIFRGMKKILEDDEGAKGERKLVADGFPISADFSVPFIDPFNNNLNLSQRVNVVVYAFNERDSSKKDENSILGDKPVLFTLGQQIQGGLDGRFLSSLGLSSVRNSLMIVLDFPDIHPSFKKDLFMTDRERLLDKEPLKLIKNYLKAYLEGSDELHEFKNKRIEDGLKNTLSNDSEDLKELMNKWVSKNPSLLKGLMTGQLVVGGGTEKSPRSRGPKTKTPKVPIILKEEPTHFTLKMKKNEGLYQKKVTQNTNFTINFTTDAPENYFDRTENPVDLKISFEGKEIDSNFVKSMKPGVFSITFTKDFSRKLKECQVKVFISCDTTGFDFNNEFTLIITKKEDGPHPGNNKMGLPDYREISLSTGYDGVTEETAAMLDGELVLINVDNKYLKAHLQGLKDSESDGMFAKALYVYSMLFSTISAKASFNSKDTIIDADNAEDDVYEVIIRDTMAVARTLFVTENLIVNLKKGL
ncbi:hypothetical protein [Sporosarcina sp. FA15]|uniref:hypothetical protein n=1 Tax=Sporosarcina sp. FA15 TaxID=3413031 RepID=UPI003F6557E1